MTTNTDDCRHKITTAKTVDEVAEFACLMLDNLCTLGAYVSSANTHNVIIKCEQVPKLGSLRISDTPCDPSYCTRWNLTMGGFVKVISKYKSYWYEADVWCDLKDHMLRYANTIQQNNQQAASQDMSGSEQSHKPIGTEYEPVSQEDKNTDAAYWAHVESMNKGGQ